MPSYNSNTNEVVINLTKKLEGLKDTQKFALGLAQTIQASNLRRIHNEGKDVNGVQIGTYNSEPIYVNPDNSPRKFAVKGKTGKSEFKNGKKHKTKYFSEGYKGFRSQIGRQTSKVDLNLTGQLSKEFGIEAQGKDYVIGFTTQEAVDKANGNEERFGKRIWGLSKDDKKLIDQAIEEFINKTI